MEETEEECTKYSGLPQNVCGPPRKKEPQMDADERSAGYARRPISNSQQGISDRSSEGDADPDTSLDIGHSLLAVGNSCMSNSCVYDQANILNACKDVAG